MVLRLGLLGGTFNPIHLGHLRGVEAAREALNLDKVCFIPAALPPHKNERPEVSAAQRLEMVRLAVKDNPAFFVSDVELSRGGTSYSIDTVLYFRKQYPEAGLFFVVGLDSFLEVTTWKRYEDLFSLCHFVVLNRIGSKRSSLSDLAPRSFWADFRHGGNANHWIHGPTGLSTVFLDGPLTDISSSEIRERIRTRRSVRYMMKEKVEAYIHKRGFYSGRQKRTEPSP
jgi:nicotinate-nucleotide adenylyltransferase